eukprot:3868656-Rhodomonas_salina.1
MAPLLQNKEVGEVWVSHILTPIAFGSSLAQFDDFVIRGKLIGLRKPNEVDAGGGDRQAASGPSSSATLTES